MLVIFQGGGFCDLHARGMHIRHACRLKYREYYMSAPVLLNLLNKLGKRDKMYGSPGGTFLLITYHLSLITYYLLLITYYLSLITYYLLLIISFFTPKTAGNPIVHSL